MSVDQNTKNVISSELKLVSEMSKKELGLEFYSNSKEILEYKEKIKFLEKRNSEIEVSLLPQIGLKYQPKDTTFMLIPKVVKGKAVPSYKKVVELVPEKFDFSNKEKTLLKKLVGENTPTPKDSTKIQIVE